MIPFASASRLVFRRVPMKFLHGIVAGGGWSKPGEHRIKFKAVCCLVLAFPVAIASTDFAGSFGSWLFAFPAGMVLISSLLSWFERPVIWPGFPDGGRDLRQLHSRNREES